MQHVLKKEFTRVGEFEPSGLLGSGGDSLLAFFLGFLDVLGSCAPLFFNTSTNVFVMSLIWVLEYGTFSRTGVTSRIPSSISVLLLKVIGVTGNGNGSGMSASSILVAKNLS